MTGGSAGPWRADPRDPNLGLVRVKVIPGASRTAIAGLRATAEGEALLIRVAAAPEKGKANEELVAWLSGALGLPRSSIELRSGATSRLKILALPIVVLDRLQSLVP